MLRSKLKRMTESCQRKSMKIRLKRFQVFDGKKKLLKFVGTMEENKTKTKLLKRRLCASIVPGHNAAAMFISSGTASKRNKKKKKLKHIWPQTLSNFPAENFSTIFLAALTCSGPWNVFVACLLDSSMHRNFSRIPDNIGRISIIVFNRWRRIRRLFYEMKFSASWFSSDFSFAKLHFFFFFQNDCVSLANFIIN